MNSPSIAPPPPQWPGAIPNVHAARCAYHYLEELALCAFSLTAEERQLSHLLLQGLMYQQIAQLLFRSESTIKSDAHRIFAKVRVKDRRAFEQHIHALVESL